MAQATPAVRLEDQPGGHRPERRRPGLGPRRGLRRAGRSTWSRAEERKRFFDEDATARRWTIKDEVRSLVTWKLHNLLMPLREEPFDCIFLKNVLIYFDTASKQTVVQNVLAALAKRRIPGGRPHRGDLHDAGPADQAQALALPEAFLRGIGDVGVRPVRASALLSR